MKINDIHVKFLGKFRIVEIKDVLQVLIEKLLN